MSYSPIPLKNKEDTGYKPITLRPGYVPTAVSGVPTAPAISKPQAKSFKVDPAMIGKGEIASPEYYAKSLDVYDPKGNFVQTYEGDDAYKKARGLADTIGGKVEKSNSFGQLGRVLKGAYTGAKATIDDSSNRLFEYGKSITDPKATPLDRVVKLTEAVVGGINLVFIPVISALEGGKGLTPGPKVMIGGKEKELPSLQSAVKGLTTLFEKGAELSQKEIDIHLEAIPDTVLSPEIKEKIRPVLGEIATLINLTAAGKVTHSLPEVKNKIVKVGEIIDAEYKTIPNKEGGFVSLPGEKSVEKVPSFKEAQDMIKKEGGFANAKSLPATNVVDAVELAKSLSLNEKYLYEQATQRGVKLRDYLNRLDRESDVSKRLAVGDELMIKLSEESERSTQDITIYRGTGGDLRPNTTFVSGKYFADSEQFASKYGKVSEAILPAGSKIFDFDLVKSRPDQKIIPQEVLLDPQATRKWLLDKGYDATKNKNVEGTEYVILNEDKISGSTDIITPRDLFYKLEDNSKYSELRSDIKNNIKTQEDVSNWLSQPLSDYLRSTEYYKNVLQPYFKSLPNAEKQTPLFKKTKEVSPEKLQRQAKKQGVPFNVTIEEAKKLVSEIFNKDEIDFLFPEGLLEGGDFWGRYTQAKKFKNPLIEVVSNDGKISDMVLYHESFHAYLDRFLSSEEKRTLLDAVIKNKATLPKRVVYRTQGYKGKYELAEEYAADAFAEWLRDKKLKLDPATTSIFQKILAKIKEWIRKITGLEDMFERVIAKDRSYIKRESRVLNVQSLAKKKRLSLDEVDLTIGKVVNRLKDLFKEGKNVEQLRKGLSETRMYMGFVKDALKNNPAKYLSKYVSKTTGRLPEVTGKGTMESLTGSRKIVQAGQFTRRGDDIVTELGFRDPDHAQVEYDKYLKAKENLKALRQQVKSESVDKRIIESYLASTKAFEDLRTKEINALQEAYELTDPEINSILRNRNYRRMSEEDFTNLIDEVNSMASEVRDRSEALLQLKGTLFDREFKNADNLQKALKLPAIENMSTEQLREFDKILSEYERGDEFLSVRKLETIDRTSFKGIKTLREARQKVAEKLNMPPEDLKIDVSEFDRMSWDTVLAEKNPFYRYFVEGFNASILEGDAVVAQAERTVNRLFGEARKGKGIGSKIIPQDKKIMEYLESTDKLEVAKTMTRAEIEAAEYVRFELEKARRYLLETEALKQSRYDGVYVPHIQRTFLEALKESGVRTAFKEMFNRYKLDEQVLTILDQKTGEILPFEKWFKFSMFRTGELVPTQNVARAFMTYVRNFERKRALDRIVPEVMTAVDVVSPREMTPRGLAIDDRLKTLVTEYLNTKKGRPVRLFVKPGGKVDWLLRSVKSFTNLIDLGFNIPLQIGSHGGVQTALYTILGPKKYTIGRARFLSKKGRDMVKQFENYTGKTPWDDLLSASKGLPEKAHNLMFAIFRDATVRGNKIHLLGSLTKEEWASGVISNERLAGLRTEAGRWLPLENAESILGSTIEGNILTQYRKWAIPIVRTTIKDVGRLIKMIGTGEWTKAAKSREFWELFRVTQVASVVALIAYAIGSSLEDDDSFTGKIIQKTMRDALSLVSAYDPKNYTQGIRLTSFLEDTMATLSSLVRLEEYKTSGQGYKKGDLKGLNRAKNLLLPAFVDQLMPQEKSKKTKKAGLMF